MRILLVEDEIPKREHITRFLSENFPLVEISLAASVRSGISAIEASAPDLLLLDMSLPTFDVGNGEGGGRPQGAGGIEIFRYIDLLELELPVIVVTAYPIVTLDGTAMSHDELARHLEGEHPRLFRGLVYFNSAVGQWQRELSDALVSGQLL